MSNTQTINPCVRCGKPRILVSTTEEIINGSKIVSEITTCPDPECQKKVEVKLESDRIDRQHAMEMNKADQNQRGRNKGRNSIFLGKAKKQTTSS